MELPLADVDVATKAGKYVLYVLAVAGGFLVGNLLTWVVCRAVAKLALKRKMNTQLERAVRILGGIAVALLVAYLLFQFGPGWGLGGSGSGEGQGSGTSGQIDDRPDTSKEKVKLKPKEDEAILATSLRVTVGKASPDPPSFRFEGDGEGLSLEKAKQRIKALRDQSGKKLQLLELRVFKNSTEVGNPEVRAFLDYANSLDIHTKVEKVDEQLQ